MKILVAGIGNVFLGDDGFGPAVAERLRARDSRPGVEVIDFGIRGMDLAFALTAGIDAAILVDAVARGGAPGTLYVIAPEDSGSPAIEGHAMDPATVLALAGSFGTLPVYVRVVGCEPGAIPADGDVDVGLSPAIVHAIDGAADLVTELVDEAHRSCSEQDHAHA